MKRLLSLCLGLILLLALPALAEVKTGEADGYNGPIKATLTIEDGKIVKVELEGNETIPAAQQALKDLPEQIVAAQGSDVDHVAGATYTMKGVKLAVDRALGVAKEENAEDKAAVVAAAEATFGFGVDNSARIGPGKDDKDTQVYSFNEVFASAIFDKEGRILYLNVDQIEVATPNYDGEHMPHFAGWPGQEGYNYDSNHDEKVDDKLIPTAEGFGPEIEGFLTKRQRGDTYKLSSGTWTQEMDAFQQLFLGMTVQEVEDWLTKYSSDRNGRPLKAGSSNEQDAAKYDALSDEDKAMLADVTTMATMSLTDSHGNILNAIKKAYENRQPLTASAATGIGFGVHNSGRVGPGKDDKDVQVYSFNQVLANTLFDAEGRIVYLWVDQIEVATPNYDGDKMPHFTGWPGVGSYNYDSNHDEKVDEVLAATEDGFKEEVAGWLTKRERGDSYKLNSGTWTEEMDAFQQLFLGKTVEEVEQWFAKYGSDRNGRPLKAGSSNEQDAAKYDALSDEEKAMLADVTTLATMSLRDSHGDILGAIKASFEHQQAIELKLGN